MKIAWNRVILTVIILGMIIWLTVALFSGRQKEFICNGVNIVMENDGKLVTCDDVRDIIKESRILGIGKPVYGSDLKKLEELLSSKSYLTNVRIKNTSNGVVNVIFRQRVPAVILSDCNGDLFYLDSEAYLFPMSKKKAYDVPLVAVKLQITKKGKMAKDSLFAYRLLDFIGFVSKNSFWNKRVRQLEIDKNENMVFTDCSDSICIRFGEMTKYEEKMNSLQTFYTKIKPQEKYKIIDLRFNKRIVAVK
ncbi:MAG: cell division protein FtsQ/DivIB [Prevotellaceae bacterium]|jgi:hypothetical protein|nr:cell division protein FtsQ/DivIB [Prevotellaceae bacterium]